MAAPYDEQAVTDMVDAIMGTVAGRDPDAAPSASVVGPALTMTLTELAKADGMGLEQLQAMVSAHYAVATGGLFKRAKP